MNATTTPAWLSRKTPTAEIPAAEPSAVEASAPEPTPIVVTKPPKAAPTGTAAERVAKLEAEARPLSDRLAGIDAALANLAVPSDGKALAGRDRRAPGSPPEGRGAQSGARGDRGAAGPHLGGAGRSSH